MKAYLFPLAIFGFIIIFFFRAFVFEGKLPIPSDTIVGLYHPFRDLSAREYPNGIPFKNFLITDVVRQQYPFRHLATETLKNFANPLWNPYQMAGYPLLAGMQSAPLYPLNILFFVLPFPIAWGILIFLQPLFAGIFLYLYLSNLRLSKFASFLGGVVFAFSGFSVAWLEWGTVVHVALWLPLILLSIDKVFAHLHSPQISNFKFLISNQIFKIKKYKIWATIYIVALTSSFFAGHLQTFFYLSMFSLVYFLLRWVQSGKEIKILRLYLILNTVFLIFTFVQWIPTLQFILESARDVDQKYWQNPGWFIPWQHLIQFLVPDFFGNPTTLNYWGEWNYAELIGYVGVLPFILAVGAIASRRDKKTLFFTATFLVALLFALPTAIGKLPFLLQLPFISSAQPTRLLFIIDFSLAVLTALGFDYLINGRKRVLYAIGIISLLFLGLWGFLIFGIQTFDVINAENLAVTRRNMVLPTALMLISVFSILALLYCANQKRIQVTIYILFILVSIFDLLWFANKFTPFTAHAYLFPSTKTIDFLQHNLGNFRLASADSRILPPNFTTYYRLQSIEGYDPLYLRRYGELVIANERNKPDIAPPFGFNRIITPHNIDSKIIDLLGVKYVLSLNDLQNPKLRKVFQEGETRVYENSNVLPRAFFVTNIVLAKDKQEAMNVLFNTTYNPNKTAIVETENTNLPTLFTNGAVTIDTYKENIIEISTRNNGDGFLVLTDSYYPIWHATIDGKETVLYRTNYHFRGAIIPKGEHKIVFYTTLL